jgi:hypothetical protein
VVEIEVIVTSGDVLMAQKNPDRSEGLKELLSRLEKEEYWYVTTTGRATGKPHKIEIWFGSKITLSIYSQVEG